VPALLLLFVVLPGALLGAAWVRRRHFWDGKRTLPPPASVALVSFVLTAPLQIWCLPATAGSRAKRNVRPGRTVQSAASLASRSGGSSTIVTKVCFDDDGDDGDGGDGGMWMHDKFNASDNTKSDNTTPSGASTAEVSAEDSGAASTETAAGGEASASDDDDSGDDSGDDAAAEAEEAKAAVLIQNLSAEITEENLYDLFEPFGNVLETKVYTDTSGAPTGMGKVVYEKKESAEKSIAEYDGRPLDNLTLRLALEEIKPTEKPVTKKKKKQQQKRQKRKLSTTNADGLPVKVKLSSGGVRFKITFDDEESIEKATSAKRKVVIAGKRSRGAKGIRTVTSKGSARRTITIDVDADGNKLNSTSKNGKAAKSKSGEREYATGPDGRWSKNADVAKLNNNTGRNRNIRGVTSDGREQRGRGLMQFGTMRADREPQRRRNVPRREAGGSETGNRGRSRDRAPRRDQGNRSRSNDRNRANRQGGGGGSGGRRNADGKGRSAKAQEVDPAKKKAELDAKLKAYLAKN